jgi:hypothetical protein
VKTARRFAGTLVAVALVSASIGCGGDGAGPIDVAANDVGGTDVRPSDDENPIPLPEVYEEEACSFCVPEGNYPCGCDNGRECVDGRYCAWVDPPSCAGKECGDDGIGGTCGTCLEGWSCTAAGRCRRDCTPDCEGKACGPDGCGGSCRSWDVFPYGDDCEPDANGSCWCMQFEILCADVACGYDYWGDWCGGCPEGRVCAPDQSGCIEPVFGRATRVDALYVPLSVDEVGADAVAATWPSLSGSRCLDLDVDGVPDHGAADLFWNVLPGFGVDVNAVARTALADGTLDVVIDLGSAPTDGPLALGFYLAEPSVEPGLHHVTSDAWTSGLPLALLDGSEMTDGHLAGGPYIVPSRPLLEAPFSAAGLPPLDVDLDRVHFVATVEGPVDDDGVALRDGSLGAVLYKADLDRALYLLRRWCAHAPDAPEEACGYANMLDTPLLDTFVQWDKDYPGCDKKLQLYDPGDPEVVVGEEENCQALSLCLFWSSAKARLTGMSPAR